jgi:hypothetical protein
MEVSRLRKHHEEVTSRSHREAAIMGLEAGISAFTAGA